MTQLTPATESWLQHLIHHLTRELVFHNRHTDDYEQAICSLICIQIYTQSIARDGDSYAFTLIRYLFVDLGCGHMSG